MTEKRRKRKTKITTSCSILKSRISAAKNRKTRGAALGKYAAAGCIKRGRRKRHTRKR